MHWITPSGLPWSLTWFLTVGVVVYSFIAFVGYGIHLTLAHRRRHRLEGEKAGSAQ